MRHFYRWLTNSDRYLDPDAESMCSAAFTLGFVLAVVLLGIVLLLVYG